MILHRAINAGKLPDHPYFVGDKIIHHNAYFLSIEVSVKESCVVLKRKCWLPTSLSTDFVDSAVFKIRLIVGFKILKGFFRIRTDYRKHQRRGGQHFQSRRGTREESEMVAVGPCQSQANAVATFERVRSRQKVERERGWLAWL